MHTGVGLLSVRHAYVYGERERFRGRFTPPPNPSRVFLRSAGLSGLASPIPPRCYAPPPGSAVPPEGEVPGDFSLGLPLVGVRKERRTLVGSSLLNSRACAQPPGGAGGFARGSYERQFFKRCLRKTGKKVDNQLKMIQKELLLSCSYSRSVKLLPEATHDKCPSRCLLSY